MAKNKQRTSLDCNGCGEPARLVTGAELYPHRPDLAHVRAWVCAPCDRRVGCHNGTTNPKGRMTDTPIEHDDEQISDVIESNNLRLLDVEGDPHPDMGVVGHCMQEYADMIGRREFKRGRAAGRIESRREAYMRGHEAGAVAGLVAMASEPADATEPIFGCRLASHGRRQPARNCSREPEAARGDRRGER